SLPSLFFFSSRRRHTSFSRDWSSDVCSSDLDRFSALDGVARVRVGGGQRYAMRIWLDRNQLAARGLTANDVENALRAENVELPAGYIESDDNQFTVRVQRYFRSAEEFGNLVLERRSSGYLVRLKDVARVEK